MMQHQIVQSPARLGLTNPNSPSLQNQNPTPPKFTTTQPPQQQPPPAPSNHSSTLLPLLPPLPRAQALLLQMASLASKLFEVSPHRALWLSTFRGTLPSFLSSQIQSQPPPPLEQSPSSAKEITALFTGLQTQLFEAVAELQEILNLQDAKQKIARDIKAKDSNLLNFTNKIKDSERVLDILVDDYPDYRRLKRSKTENYEENEEDDDDEESTTTMESQLKLSDILSYAHRISYTTFAPPEFGANTAPLRVALPPAPQDEQMRASQLYAFADLDVGLPKTIDSKEKTIEAIIEPPPPPTLDAANPLANITIPAGWKPGMPVELPTNIPVPPPGWKPGDPITLPQLESLPVPRMDGQPTRPVVPHPFHKPPELIQVKHVDLDISDQDDDSDYTSSSDED